MPLQESMFKTLQRRTMAKKILLLPNSLFQFGDQERNITILENSFKIYTRANLNAIKASLTWDSPDRFTFPNRDANRLHYFHLKKKIGFAFLSKPISGIHSLNISLTTQRKKMMKDNMEFEMEHTHWTYLKERILLLL